MPGKMVSKVNPGSGELLVRLNKVLAAAGICSRRRADELILQGAVKVNAQIVTSLGFKVRPGQDILEVEGRKVKLNDPARQDHEYLLLHKPTLTLTTMNDPLGRRTVMDMLPPEIRRQRPRPVGRLDCMSEGLLLLTTDGELTFRLTHPRWQVEKVYRLAVLGRIESAKLELMRQGMTLKEGESLTGIKVRTIMETNKETELELTLIQGLNRQIRRMCRDLNLPISWLRRIRQGPVCLGDLPEGQWRRLSRNEIEALKKQVGMDESP